MAAGIDNSFSTARVQDNEVVKAGDFTFAFEQLVNNIALFSKLIFEGESDFIIGGSVSEYTGTDLSVVVSPMFGVCKSTQQPFACSETSDPITLTTSTVDRVAIIEAKGVWKSTDLQQRAFSNYDTGTRIMDSVDTKEFLNTEFKVSYAEGVAAPTTDEGYVKLCEIVIPANATDIGDCTINNIDADYYGLNNSTWTTDIAGTFNAGLISDINKRFRVAHNFDGSHKANSILSSMILKDNSASGLNASKLPISGSITIGANTGAATDSIYSTITSVVSVLNQLYNWYSKYGTYNFKGALSLSNLESNGVLTNPLVITNDGAGNASISLSGHKILDIKVDENGKYTLTTTDEYNIQSSILNTNTKLLVTTAVTNALFTRLSSVENRVTTLENAESENKKYINSTISLGSTDSDHPTRFDFYTTSAVVLATTSNIGVPSPSVSSIDGHTLVDGEYVLVKNEDDATNNGLWQVSTSSTWSRVDDFNQTSKLKGKIIEVTVGTVNGGRMFYCPSATFTSNAFGTDEIEFLEYQGSKASVKERIPVRNANGQIKINGNNKNYSGPALVKQDLLDLVYPIGSLYWSSKNVSPQTFLGGTWTQIKDTFVLAAGDTYTAESDSVFTATDGAATVTLLEENLPAHTHDMEHYHDRGTMEIVGSVTPVCTFRGNSNGFEHTGAFSTSSHYDYFGNSNGSNSQQRININLKASNGWTGKTSGSLANSTTGDTTAKTNTGSTGSGVAHENMPPYVVKYCWERVA